MKPRIAVTVGPDEARDAKWRPYLFAIEQAGGQVELVFGDLDPAEVGRLLSRFDGLLVPGGADISPDVYGGRPHPSVRLSSPARDALELDAARIAKLDGVPALGICRGIQIMNVALGGTIYEDIGDQHEAPNGPRIRHQQLEHGHHRSDKTHPVDILPGSKLAAIAGGPCMETNSTHHQAVRRVAYDLLVVARARDGIVEALELAGAHPFYVGVQWHPEELVGNDEPSRRLFREFVRAAAARAADRATPAGSASPG